MNQLSASSPSTSNLAPDAISRRAYELWEKEGRPDGSDLRHWLQAEQELSGSPATYGNGSSSQDIASTARHSDVTPLQGTRAASAAARETTPKRGSATPFAREKSSAAPSQNAKRKSPSTPAL